jgi:putative tryptophan/tyrosine transport system substrate-binding protein
MRRREFIALTGASVTWPFAAEAQQALPTVGVMSPASPTTTIFGALFPKLMKEFGWEENRDYRAVFRFAEGHVDRFPVFTEELLAEKVNVIIALGEAGIQAAQRATKTVPIVGIAADMIRTGLAASTARPGGNLTGVNVLGNELDLKRLEILHEAVPAAKRIGALALPARGFDTLPELEAAARQLSLELVVITVRSLSELTGSLDALQSPRVDAINVLGSALVLPNRAKLVEALNRARLPAIYDAPEVAESGGFLAYGASVDIYSRPAARLAFKILRGARPEDLPIEQPDRFDLVINLRTANTNPP